MLNDKPLVSIGVPVYNGAKYVTETLDSINDQSYPNIEILIVDDGSSDDSFNLCKEWAMHARFRTKVQKNFQNLGVTKTCNIILKESNGRYFHLFGQDDKMHPKKIEHDVGIFEKLNENTVLLYSKVRLINENGELLDQNYNERIGVDGFLSNDPFAQLIKSNFIPAPTAITRTDIIKKIGGFDESLLFEDWDMWLRLARDYEIFFSDTTNVYYRIHSNSMMENKEIKEHRLRNEANIKMIKKHVGYGKLHDYLLYNKLKELSIYSYFLDDKNATSNLHWLLQKKFDAKVWLYHKLSKLRIKHHSKLTSFLENNPLP